MVAGLPRVGGLATLPTRMETARAVVGAAVRQVDRLYVYLDGHERLPDFARHEKIIPISVAEMPGMRSSGKFLGLLREQEPCVYVTFDDDIRYPANYVDTLVAALARFSGRVMAGVQGSLFRVPFNSFSQDVEVCTLSTGLSNDVRVDMLGTGTSALVSSTLPIDPRRWPEKDIDDLMASLDAERLQIPRVAIAREPKFLVPLAEDQADSLWVAARRDDTRQTMYMRELLMLEAKSRLGLPPRPHSTPAPSSAGIAPARNMRKSSRPMPY